MLRPVVPLVVFLSSCLVVGPGKCIFCNLERLFTTGLCKGLLLSFPVTFTFPNGPSNNVVGTL